MSNNNVVNMPKQSLLLRIEDLEMKLKKAQQKREDERVNSESKIEILKDEVEYEKEKTLKYKEISENMVSQKLELEACLRRVQRRLNMKQESFTKLMTEKQMTQEQLKELQMKLESED